MITLLHPSRGRARQAYDTAHKWISKAGCDVEHIFSLDLGDSEYQKYTPFKKCLINDNHSVVEATNIAAKEAEGDILVYLSDDFDCFDNWGIAVIEALDRLQIKQPEWLLKVDDCLQKFDVDVLTIPIMSKALYQKLGYFWHPSYRSMFVDQDLYWTVSNMNALFKAPWLKFEHKHYSVGKCKIDETYQRSNENWNTGKSLYHQRKAQNFPV